MAKCSFKLKLILSYFFLILVSLGFVLVFLDNNLHQKTLQEITQSLTNQAYLIESRISALSGPFNNAELLDELSKKLGQKIGARVTVIGLNGEVLADSEVPRESLSGLENHLYKRPEVSSALDGKLGREIRYSSTLKIDMLYLALPIIENGAVAGILRLALPLISVQKVHSTARKVILIGLLLALVLATFLGLLLTNVLIRPISRIINASLNFAKGDFSHRILEDSNDEIGELAATLNKMAQDIEDKIREIATKSQHLEAIFNSMVEGVIVTDKAGRVVSINQAVEKVFEVTMQTVKGKVFLEAIRNKEISDIVDSILNDCKPISKEIDLFFPVQRIFEINATPILSQDGVNGALLVIHNITEIRRLEVMRRDFVANVSHELKTPLTAIKGFVETLLEGALEDKENNRNFLKIIQGHADRLDTLVNDLLSLSHLESKGITINKANFNLSLQVKEVLRGFRLQLDSAGIKAVNELPQELFIIADKERLHQVLVNLIGNAIKFNKEKGFIKICSEISEEAIKVIIEDSGIGIPQKDVPRIFERFYRVDKARSRELGGTGLGLSIVKHIIELHSGSVGVESIEGLGSKFFFIVPQKNS